MVANWNKLQWRRRQTKKRKAGATFIHALAVIECSELAFGAVRTVSS
jgi:hypothetical protein